MKSTFGQLTIEELKKRLSLGYELVTYQLESGVDFAIPPMFCMSSKKYERKTYPFEPFLNLVAPPMYQSVSLEEYEKNEKTVKKIVKQILRHHYKAFYDERPYQEYSKNNK